MLLQEAFHARARARGSMARAVKARAIAMEVHKEGTLAASSGVCSIYNMQGQQLGTSKYWVSFTDCAVTPRVRRFTAYCATSNRHATS